MTIGFGDLKKKQKLEKSEAGILLSFCSSTTGFHSTALPSSPLYRAFNFSNLTRIHHQHPIPSTQTLPTHSQPIPPSLTNTTPQSPNPNHNTATYHHPIIILLLHHPTTPSTTLSSSSFFITPSTSLHHLIIILPLHHPITPPPPSCIHTPSPLNNPSISPLKFILTSKRNFKTT